MNSKIGLDSLERFGWRFGLDSMRALLAELDHPEISLRFIHVAGSNGKGSTCAFLASFLRQSGYRTGLYTSPHLCDIRERFRLNGVWINPKSFRRYSAQVLEACGKVERQHGHSPTHFEALTAIAFLWFRDEKADWVVLETGLGGRLDATNIIGNPALCLITPIGLEHQDILGRTLGKIAWEKSGILKPGSPAVTCQPHREALRAIEKTAEEKGVPLWAAGKDFFFKREAGGFQWEGPGFRGRLKIPHLPDFQIANASLALAGIRRLEANGVPSPTRLLEKSFRGMKWPGRMEILQADPLVLMDGAHNPEAAKGLAGALSLNYPKKKWIVLNGFLKDKDYVSCARILAPHTRLSIVTEPVNNRAEPGEKVFAAWEKAGVGGLWINDWRKALDLALKKARHSPGAGLLITGSLYLLGDCRKVLEGTRGLDRI